MHYKRALCKLSGESLSAQKSVPYEECAINLVRDALIQAHQKHHELAIVIGAGNLFRGSKSNLPYPKDLLDEVGMLATVMNGKILSAALEKKGIKTALFNAFSCGEFAENYSTKKAKEALENGSIVIFTGGISHPYLTTDTAAALRASQISADVLVKLSTVDGIYTQDPKKVENASKKERITYDEVIEKQLGVMDLEAICLCKKNAIPIVVTSFSDPEHLEKALSCDKVGTLVTAE